VAQFEILRARSLAPLVKARGFGMTPSKRKSELSHSNAPVVEHARELEKDCEFAAVVLAATRCYPSVTGLRRTDFGVTNQGTRDG